MPNLRQTLWKLVLGAGLLLLGACNLQRTDDAPGRTDYPYDQIPSVAMQLVMIQYVLADIGNQFTHRYWGWERRNYRENASRFKDFYREVPESFYREVERIFAQAARIQPLLRDPNAVDEGWRQVVHLAEATEVAPHMVVNYRFTTKLEVDGLTRRVELMRAVVDFDRWKILYWTVRPNLQHPFTEHSRQAMAAVSGCERPSRQPYRIVLPPGVGFDDLATHPDADRIFYAITCREPFGVYFYDTQGHVYRRRAAQSAEGFELVQVAEFDPAAR